jgi:TPR repeat protein
MCRSIPRAFGQRMIAVIATPPQSITERRFAAPSGEGLRHWVTEICEREPRMIQFNAMNQISRPPVPLQIRSRALLSTVTCVSVALLLITLLAFRRDLTIEVGITVWMVAGIVATILFFWTLVWAIKPLPLVRVTADGILFCRLLSEPIPWSSVKRIEAATERGVLGDAHDHLVIFFRHPRILRWRGARGRRRDSAVPQAAMTVPVGLAWPIRAQEVRSFLRDAAQQVADPAKMTITSYETTTGERIGVVAMLCLSITVPAGSHWADIGLPRLFAKGIAYYDAGQISDAIPHLENDARAGDGESARILGEIFLNGDGGDRNLALSTAWFQRGAARGDAWSAFRLGDAYRHGLGIQQSIPNALIWLTDAADAEIAQAAFSLGDIYRTGNGVIRDYGKAIDYLENAARLGFAAAEHDLGRLYHDGIALPHDAAEARRWYKSAIARGHIPAKYDLARLYLSGDRAAHAKGMQVLIDAASDGHPPAMRLLAHHYQRGEGVPRDLIAAYQYIALSARHWPAATRTDVIKERAIVGAELSPDELAEAKTRVRAWRPATR